MDEYARKNALQAKQTREQNLKNLETARTQYGNIANERLRNIANKDTLNPWLAMKQGWTNQMDLIPAEHAVLSGAAQSDPTQSRDARWDEAIRQAELLQGTGKLPKTFIP